MMPTIKPAKVVRYSCKCKLCKAKWTTELSDYMATYNAHEPNCPGYSDYFLKRTKGMVRPMTRDRMAAEQYQMACFCLDRRPIQGRYNAEIKCDGRCMGATGHNCECSCGGANHGKAMAA